MVFEPFASPRRTDKHGGEIAFATPSNQIGGLMLTHAVTTAVAAIARRGSPVRRRWPAVLLAAAALLLASAGSAAAAPSPITVNEANWSASAGFGSAAPGWYEDSYGLVHLEGAAKQTSASGGLSAITLGTLPKAARPARDLFFMAHTFDGTYAVIQIDTDGTIFVDRPAAPAVTDFSFVSLESIVYLPADLPVGDEIDPGSGWTSTFDAVASPPAWFSTPGAPNNDVALQGTTEPTNVFDDSDPPNPLGTLPPAADPSRVVYTIVPAGGADGETYADVDIQPSGAINLINARPPALTDTNLVSLEGVSFRQDPVNISLSVNTNNWSPNAGFGAGLPGWYEDSAGIIHLEGAVRQTDCTPAAQPGEQNCGQNLTVIGTLPPEARPTRDVYTIVHTFDGTYADLVIQTNGEIININPRPPAVTDLSFLSLEGITFDAPSPKFFGLAAHGTQQQGATVTAMLSHQRSLALVVSAERGGRLVNVGVVHLGTHKAGLSHIHWNLVVNQRALPAGRYEVSLHALNGAILSLPAAPGARTLVVQANGHIHTQ
jgi:hypothetical protein